MNKSIFIVISIAIILFFIMFSLVLAGLSIITNKKQIKPINSNIPVKTAIVNNINPTISTKINTSKPIKTKIINKNTMAYKAYNKLRSDNLLNEDFIVAIYVLQEIDENFRSIKIEEALFGTYYQTFEFSDESKIQLIKKQKDNGDFRILPYGTKIIND